MSAVMCTARTILLYCCYNVAFAFRAWTSFTDKYTHYTRIYKYIAYKHRNATMYTVVYVHGRCFFHFRSTKLRLSCFFSLYLVLKLRTDPNSATSSFSVDFSAHSDLLQNNRKRKQNTYTMHRIIFNLFATAARSKREKERDQHFVACLFCYLFNVIQNWFIRKTIKFSYFQANFFRFSFALHINVCSQLLFIHCF